MDKSLTLTQRIQGPKFGTAGVVRPDPMVIYLPQEFNPDLEEKRYEFSLEFPPTNRPSSLSIKTLVHQAQARKSMGSASYLASIRRREAGGYAKSLRDLSLLTNDEHFIVWTHEVLENLRRAVKILADAEESAYPEREGNACEILREVRDSFPEWRVAEISGGWCGRSGGRHPRRPGSRRRGWHQGR